MKALVCRLPRWCSPLVTAYKLPNHRFLLSSGTPIRLVADDAPTSWVHIACEGEWQGHAQGGFELDRDTFAGMVANFKAQKNPLPVTYEHPDHRGDGKPIPAAGWIHDLSIKSDGLYALVEWVKDAADMIRSGAYKFCSMVFSTDSESRETGAPVGPELFELGLTNTPFIDGLKPLMLSRNGAARRLAMVLDKQAIKDAIDALPKDAGAEQVHKAIEGVLLIAEAQEKPVEEAPVVEAPEAEPAEMSCLPKKASIDPVAAAAEVAPGIGDKEQASSQLVLDKLMSLTGLDEAGALAFLTDNAAAIEKLAGKQADSGMPADQAALSAVREETLTAKVTELSRQLDAYRAREAEETAKALEAKIDKAIELGHILPHHREVFVKLGRSSATDLDEELVKLSRGPAVPTGRIALASNSENAVDPADDVERAIVERNRTNPELMKLAIAEYRKRSTKKLNGRA